MIGKYERAPSSHPQPHDPTLDMMMCFFKPPAEALTWGLPPPPPPPSAPPKGRAAALQLLAAAASTAALQGGRSLLGSILRLLPQARKALQEVRLPSQSRRHCNSSLCSS